MNIWCISKYTSPAKYSKMPARLFYFCQEWIELGHNVHLITSDSNHLANYPDTVKTYNDEVIDCVPVTWIKTKKYQKSNSFARILSWFDFEKKLFALDTSKLAKPDVVIVSSLSLLSIMYGYHLKRKYNSTLVFEVRDIWPLTMTEEMGFSKWHPLTLFLGEIEKFGYTVADLIVGTMPRLDLHVKEIIKKDFKFHCAPLGFHPKNYEDMSQFDNPFENTFPKDKLIVGYAGSMGVTNALEPYIQVIKELEANEKIFFVLVGSGDLRANYEAELKDCKNVMFLPRIPQNDVKFLLDKCDVLYLSTKDSKVWKYGQSMNKVVEYMLAAKPIIATYTGYPSMLNEAQCGFFISSNDEKSTVENIKKAIVEIAQLDVQERNEMGLRGRSWIRENRSYNKLATEYLDQINKIHVN